MFRVARYPRAKPEVNNFLVRWRAVNRTPRFDKSTGQPRKRWSLRDTRGIAAVVALALVVGSGLAVVSVSSAAEAHTPSIKVSCNEVTVTGLYYEASRDGEGQQNLIKFQLKGGEEQVFKFSENGTKTFAFPNSTEAHTFTASVTAWNNPTHTSWNRTWTQTSTPCTSQSIIDLSAPRCEVVGGSTDITAKFKDLVAKRQYTLTLTGGSEKRSIPFTPTQTVDTYVFTKVAPGPTYTVTITDTTNTNLTASKSVQSVACPEVAGIAIVACECTVPGGDVSLKVNFSDLVIGHEYYVTVVNAGSGKVVYETTITAKDTWGVQVSTDKVETSGSYYATVLDKSQEGAEPLKSTTHTFLPCPNAIPAPVVTATQCDALSSDTSGEMSVVVNGLVPGRTYNVVVTDAAGKLVLNKSGFVASESRISEKLSGLANGAYTVTVTDVLMPRYTNSASATLVPCATKDTAVTLAAEQCTVPGGVAAITATVADYVVGRDYTVALMLNNVAVGATQKLDSSTGAEQKFTFTGLKPDNKYRVVVTDTKSSPKITAAADMFLSACPENPIVMIAQGECNVLGTSMVSVSASDLAVGQIYTVAIVTKSTGKAVEGIAPITFEADLPTQALTFSDVPNGGTYTVSIVNADKTLSAMGDVTLEECDLPTFPLPPEEPPTTTPPTVDLPTVDLPTLSLPTPDLPTLAFTGSSTIAPTIAGLGFLQLGLVLVGFSIARRRSVVRKG
ncbi:hypothetical protein [Salinibacterium sp. PAMC 21357]|uniref:hypothetical protein n=1 Tax=Salinibacterium sp. PAMC 21357 TaxID=1112215 RepID=UPI0002887FFB|nr:hypothetical protein [Salinibacterium sp. PAMC 21357]